MPGGAMGGGLGVAVLALIGYVVFGIDPSTTQQIADQLVVTGDSPTGAVGTPADLAGQFVDVIGANINDVWDARIADYTPPKVVLYERGTSTGCGYGQAAAGPFYCPTDATIYLDLEFWQEMETQLGASGAEFARAYVIAHEFGHHVQSLTGESDAASAAQRSGSRDANRLSVALELQADCYAGVWAANASAVSGGKVAPEAGDLEQGLQTANAIGDDALQSRAGRRVSPEQFTHGSSAQRVEWLRRGYQTGDPMQCATPSGR
jgi:predicted metalloprotease